MLTISAIPAFADNYIWVIRKAGSVVVVDPGDHKPVVEFLTKNDCHLSAIILTHHHSDHVNGVAHLSEQYSAPVLGPSTIGQVTQPVSEGSDVQLFDMSENFSVITVPGHTLDHLAYIGPGYLFCGDTLFSGGCGRLFEGSALMMQKSFEKFHNLPDSTLVYCTHEYTLSNLKFAISIEPDNQDLIAYMEKVSMQRTKNEITLPSTIGLEKKINPFMRVNKKTIIKVAAKKLAREPRSPAETFAVLRQMKDKF